MHNSEEFKQILAKLREPFPPEAHVERDLPGKKATWFFIPWQAIRDRLTEVCPDWTVQYDEPTYLEEYCIIKCKLTIAGVTREAWGNAPIKQISSQGNDMSRGTPIERAISDAFKNASEAFGVAAYLDDQSKDKREFTIRYLHKKGDGRALKLARENEWVPGNLPTAQQKQARQQQERNDKPAPMSGIISDAQRKRFYALAKNAGYTDPGAKKLLAAYGFESSRAITQDKYEELCRKAQDKDLVAIYNQQALATVGDW